jgi:hypothetical protein
MASPTPDDARLMLLVEFLLETLPPEKRAAHLVPKFQEMRLRLTKS